MNEREPKMQRGCQDDEQWSQKYLPTKMARHLAAPENLAPQENSSCLEYEQIMRTLINSSAKTNSLAPSAWL